MPKKITKAARLLPPRSPTARMTTRVAVRRLASRLYELRPRDDGGRVGAEEFACAAVLAATRALQLVPSDRLTMAWGALLDAAMGASFNLDFAFTYIDFSSYLSRLDRITHDLRAISIPGKGRGSKRHIAVEKMLKIATANESEASLYRPVGELMTQNLGSKDYGARGARTRAGAAAAVVFDRFPSYLGPYFPSHAMGEGEVRLWRGGLNASPERQAARTELMRKVESLRRDDPEMIVFLAARAWGFNPAQARDLFAYKRPPEKRRKRRASK